MKQITDLSIFFNKDAHWNLNKKLSLLIGYNAAVLFSDLFSKRQYFKDKKMLNSNGTFFNTMQDIYVSTGLSEHQQRKAFKVLDELDLISSKRLGIPAKKYYTIYDDLILEVMLLLSTLSNEEILEIKASEQVLKYFKDCTLNILRTSHLNTTGLYNKNKVNKNKGNNNKSKKNNNKKKEETNTLINLGNIPKVKIKQLSNSDFDVLWNLYPKKAGKGAAKSAFEKLCNKPINEKPTLQQLKKAIHHQKKSKQWSNPKLIKHFSTWLNKYAWLDDAAEMNFTGEEQASKETNPMLIEKAKCETLMFPEVLEDLIYKENITMYEITKYMIATNIPSRDYDAAEKHIADNTPSGVTAKTYILGVMREFQAKIK